MASPAKGTGTRQAATLLDTTSEPFVDPQSVVHEWARCLRPEFCGQKPRNVPISERLIEAIGTFARMQTDASLCIVGSRILQEIIGRRYSMAGPAAGRAFYHTPDTDVWLPSQETVEKLLRYLNEWIEGEVGPEGQKYQIRDTDTVHRYASGIYICPVKVVEKGKAGGAHDYCAKADLSSPLDGINTDNMDKEVSAPFLQTRGNIEWALANAMSKPLGVSKTDDNLQKESYAPGLSDQCYLDLIEKTLVDPYGRRESKEKVLSTTLPLLVYLEMTRVVIHWGKPDEFSLRLLQLCWRHHKGYFDKALGLLKANYRHQWRILNNLAEKWREEERHCQKYQVKPDSQFRRPEWGNRKTRGKSSDKPSKEPLKLKGYREWSQVTGSVLNELMTRLKGKETFEARLTLLFDEGLDLGSLDNALQDIPDLQELADLIRPAAVPLKPVQAVAVDKALDFPPKSKTSVSKKKKPKKYDPAKTVRSKQKKPNDFGVSDEDVEIAKLQQIAKLEREAAFMVAWPPVSLTDDVKALNDEVFFPKKVDLSCVKKKTQKDAVDAIFLELDSMVELRHAGSTAVFGQRMLVLKNDKRACRDALVTIEKLQSECKSNLEAEALIETPYLLYFNAVLLLERGEVNDFAQACMLLQKAASAGVIGAASLLLSLSIDRPACTVPSTVALRLLLEASDRRPSLNVRIYPSNSFCTPECHKIVGSIEDIMTKSNGDLASMAETLIQLAGLFHDECFERCCCLSAAIFISAGLPERSVGCLKKVGADKVAQLARSRKFDWFLLGLRVPALQSRLQVIQKALVDDPEAMICSGLVDQQEQRLLDGIVELERKGDRFWLHWLVLAVDDTVSLDIMGSKLSNVQPLWWETRRSRSQWTVCAETGKPPEEVSHQPLSLKYGLGDLLPEESDKTDMDQRSKTYIPCIDKTGMDQALISGISSTADPSASSVISLGSYRVVYALRVLGAEVSQKGVITFFPVVSEKKQKQVLKLLTSAIEKNSNPYAAWLYGRLHRCRLLTELDGVHGEKNWYQFYLKPLLFAATHGVHGAADDLFLELIQGRADLLLAPIIHMQSLRSPWCFIHQIVMDSAGAPSRGEVARNTGSTMHQSDIPRGQQAQVLLETYQSSAENAGDETQRLRLQWLAMLLGYVISSERSEAKPLIVLPDFKSDTVIPETLEFSMVMSLSIIPMSDRAEVISRLKEHLSPAAVALLQAWETCSGEHLESAAEAIPPEFRGRIWKHLQCQLVSNETIILERSLNKRMKTKRKNEYADKESQDLMCFYHHLEHDSNDDQNLDTDSLKLLAVHKQAGEQSHNERYYRTVAAELEGIDDLICSGITTCKDKGVGEQFQRLRHGIETTKQLPEISLGERTAVDLRHFGQGIAIVISQCLERYEHGASPLNLSKLTPKVCQLFKQMIKEFSRDYIVGVSYGELLKGLCSEVECTGGMTVEQQLTVAKHYLRGAIQGSDNAVQHLGRLAFVYPDSPISMDRILDLYMCQYLRSLRQHLHFDVPEVRQCSVEQNKILAVLNDVLLKDVVGAGSSKQDIKTLMLSLIPRLEALQKETLDAANYARLQLLISDCYHRAERPIPQNAFAHVNVEELPANLLIECFFQRVRLLPEKSSLSAKLSRYFKAASEKDHACYRNMLYLPLSRSRLESGSVDSDFLAFKEWHQKKNSWNELVIVMGQGELEYWLRSAPGCIGYQADGELEETLDLLRGREDELRQVRSQYAFIGKHLGQPVATRLDVAEENVLGVDNGWTQLEKIERQMKNDGVNSKAPPVKVRPSGTTD